MSKYDGVFSLSYPQMQEVLAEAGLLEFISHLPPTRSSLRLQTDTRKVRNGDVFICYKGVRFDSHRMIPQIAARGAAMVLIEDKRFIGQCSLPYALVKNSRAAWAHLVAKGFGQPQDKMKLIGVTGTNGKTSTAWLIKEMLTKLGEKVLFLGTIGGYLGERKLPLSHTTPDPPELFAALRQAVDEDVSYVVMEVSSIAVHQEKIAPLSFVARVFTSFSRDHLDYHESMEAYLACKLRFLTSGGGKNYVHKDLLKNELIEKALIPSETSSYGGDYRLRATDHGGLLNLGDRVGEMAFMGDYAADNFVVALKVVEDLLRKPLEPALWPHIRPVPGRLEPVIASGHILVDYAHTPDALERTLALVKTRVKDGQLWVVFGCGGDRDKGKRPLMAKAAEDQAHRVVVTSDNPRTEDPEAILKDIRTGFRAPNSVTFRVDRREAIAFALSQMGSNDWLVIAGKGHETYQIIGTERKNFDDRDIARQVWCELKANGQ